MYLWCWFGLGGVTLQGRNVGDLGLFVGRLQWSNTLYLVRLVVDGILGTGTLVDSLQDLSRRNICLTAGVDLQMITLFHIRIPKTRRLATSLQADL